jgi:hypothetical protein
MKTFVISAFPGCGKSYCYKNYQEYFSMLDSDSSQFSWIKDEKGNNTNERNPEFPENYIEHIKKNIGKVDIIFVSSHTTVREALKKNGIKVILVYPSRGMKDEWIRRFRERGNDERFIDFISSNWDNFISDMKEETEFLHYELSNEKAYINLGFLCELFEDTSDRMTHEWMNCQDSVNLSDSIDEVPCLLKVV